MTLLTELSQIEPLYYLIIILIAVVLVGLDKLTTYINLKTVAWRYPKVDATQIEKNFLARLFFVKYGFVVGSILYGVLSIFSFVIALLMLTWTLFSYFSFNLSIIISLTFLSIIYLVVVVWNIKMYYRFKNGNLYLKKKRRKNAI